MTGRRRRRALAAVVAAVVALIACGVSPLPFGREAARAEAGATSAYQALVPCRIVDTRGMTGRNESGVTPDAPLTLQIAGACGVPAAAVAVAITLTATDTSEAGFLTAAPADVAPPEASHLNWTDAHETRANGALVALSGAGELTIAVSAATHVIVDVTGAFVPAPESAAGRFTPVVPRRLLDTRDRGVALEIAETVHVERPPDIPPDATALAVNVAITATTHPTFVAGFAHGTERGDASLLNADGAGQTRAATAIVPINVSGFDLFNLRGGHLVVDIAGYFTGASAAVASDGLFVPGVPERLLDTRLVEGGRLIDGGAVTVPLATAVASPIVAAALNITIDANRAPGFLTAWPADTARPEVSNVNAATHSTTVANLAIVPTSAAGFNLFAAAATDVIVDIAGWFVGPYVPATPGAFPVSNDRPVDEEPEPARLPGCTADGRAAVVDKAAQRFWLCEDGVPITDELRMTTASAAYGLPPVGTHRVTARQTVGYGRNGEPLHRFVVFYTTVRGNRIGFHQYVNQDPATLGDLDQRGASDGCLRVSTDDSWRVWSFLQLGDAVVVLTN